MRRFFSFFILIASFVSFFQFQAFAAERTVIVSEEVIGARCVCGAVQNGEFQSGKCSAKVEERKFQCTVSEGLGGFQAMLAEIIRWFVYIVMLLGVLAIVGLGIAWSVAGGDDIKAKTNLKKWAINILVGMIILFFFRYILTFLAPWVYK